MNRTPTETCFKIKLCEDWVWKLNWKMRFFVPSNGHQNYLDKSLTCYFKYKASITPVSWSAVLIKWLASILTRLSSILNTISGKSCFSTSILDGNLVSQQLFFNSWSLEFKKLRQSYLWSKNFFFTMSLKADIWFLQLNPCKTFKPYRPFLWTVYTCLKTAEPLRRNCYF